MTSHRQRLQPDHHIETYAYPTDVFVDDLFHVGDEVFATSASSSNVEDAHQCILECDACINSHFKDHPTIVSLSSGSSLRAEMNQTDNANMSGS